MEITTALAAKASIQFDLCGTGSIGRRLAFGFGETGATLLTLDAGATFGGEWEATVHLWFVLEGTGQVSAGEQIRVPVTAGDAMRFERGECRLLIATSPMRVLLLDAELLEVPDPQPLS
jgi:quercetin dioxygenase-like cupin family protein